MVRSTHTTEGSAAATYRVARFLKVVLSLLLVSLIFQIAGGFSPGWQFYKVDTDSQPSHPRSHIGLWYYHACDGNDYCETGPLSDIMENFENSTITKTFKDHLKEYRGETISALVSCMIAIIALRMTRTRLHTPSVKTILVLGGFFVLLSGILSTTAAGKCADNTRKASNIHDTYGVSNYIAFPYSVFITGLGGVLSLIALLLLLASQPWRMSAGNQSPQQQQQHTHPMAVGGFSPALTTPAQTVYQPNQPPPSYEVATIIPTAPPIEHYDQSAPAYYAAST